MISVELTNDEAVTAIVLMRMGLISLGSQHQDFDKVNDAYRQLSDKIKAGKPVKQTKNSPKS